MKQLLLVIVLSFVSCKSETTCDNLKSINKTDTLSIDDSALSFYPIGKNKLSFLDLKNEKTLIFFKTEFDQIKEGYNQEIGNPFWQKLKKTNVDIIVISDLKIAGNYGVEIKNNKIVSNYLFVTDQEKKIKGIYKNICVSQINGIANNN